MPRIAIVSSTPACQTRKNINKSATRSPTIPLAAAPHSEPAALSPTSPSTPPEDSTTPEDFQAARAWARRVRGFVEEVQREDGGIYLHVAKTRRDYGSAVGRTTDGFIVSRPDFRPGHADQTFSKLEDALRDAWAGARLVVGQRQHHARISEALGAMEAEGLLDDCMKLPAPRQRAAA